MCLNNQSCDDRVNQANEFNDNFIFETQKEVRDKQYSAILTQYAENQRRMHKARYFMKWIFFIVSCTILLGVVVTGSVSIILIARKQFIGYSDFGVALASLGGIISSIITIPKIIAENLFPPSGDNIESDLVDKMQRFDNDSEADSILNNSIDSECNSIEVWSGQDTGSDS